MIIIKIAPACPAILLSNYTNPLNPLYSPVRIHNREK